MAGRGDTGKASSAATNKARAQGIHGARPENRERSGGRQENQARETLGVRGDNRGREASRVFQESSVVGDKEGGSKASGVAENPQVSRQGVGGGVDSPQGTNTPGVA